MTLAEWLASHPEGRGEAFNFSNEEQITVSELVQRILGLMGTDLEPDIRNEASNEIRAQFLSAAKARETLDWAPLYSLDEGLRRTVAWYSDLLAAR
jgi:CDP-glucose 4,6-dehydratase